MNGVRFAHAQSASPEQVLHALSDQLGEGGVGGMGLLYVNQAFSAHFDRLIERLGEQFPTTGWSGAVADHILAADHEYDEAPAAVAMLLPLPEQSWHVFNGTQPVDANAHTALVHADPAAPELDQLIRELAQRTRTGYLFGGLTGSETDSPDQIAGNRRLAGGLSGVAFDDRVRVLSRVTQGCSPLGAEHTITSCDAHYVQTLNDRPALDVMLTDLGVDESIRESRDGEAIMRALPADRLRRGLLVGLSDRLQDRPLGFGDYLVRNLIGIDPLNRVLAVNAEPVAGERLVFCTRDPQAARQDLVRVCTELRDEVESEKLAILGAHYVSCVARGSALFGSRGAETAILRHNLGDVPLLGFYANGEIARERLYGFTGVLTLFVEPLPPRE